ncbi:MAG: hypothetical protein N3F66_14325 [Spirochaetes bacterium]|nr:hypothetical protein [Spirochaetota bacterium]
MNEKIRERIEYIKKGETPPNSNQRKKRFSRIFLLINILVFIILLTLIIQKKEPTDYIYQTVVVNNIQVRCSIIHTINQPLLASVTFTSESSSQLQLKKPAITITIAHNNNEILLQPVDYSTTVLNVAPQNPVTLTTAIPIDQIKEYAKKHDLLKPKRYVYHSVIPLTVKFTLHTVMDYTVLLHFKCKVSAK